MPHSWKETRPGRWERPQSCLEKINLINRNVERALDRDNWAKTAVAKLEFDPSIGDPESALRIAWKQVRYNYPEIAAFPYNGTYMYRIGNPDQVSLWVSATFVVEPNMTVDQLLGHIPRNEQMMCYFLPDTVEVLVRSPHYRLDAQGAIFCLNHLIAQLARPDPILAFGACAKNLSPSIDDALHIPNEYTPKIEQAAAKRLAGLEPHYPLLELKPTRAARLPGATRRRFIKFPEPEMTAIAVRCQKEGLNMYVLLHAGLIAATADLSPPSETQSFMASFHCDLRYLIPESSRTKHSPTVCTSVITSEVEVSPTTDFRYYYEKLLPAYTDKYGPLLQSTACFHEKLAAKYYPGGKSSGKADCAAQPRIASLGLIDKQFTKELKGVVKVKDFWLGAETLTNKFMVHTWLWEGEGVLSCCYNESFWDDAFIEKFLYTMRKYIEEDSFVAMMRGFKIE